MRASLSTLLMLAEIFETSRCRSRRGLPEANERRASRRRVRHG
jgi:hypothetical protein